MWNNLPSDLLANIFSYLPPPSFARATATCRHWHRSATGQIRHHHHRHLPWFIALPTRTTTATRLCFIHNPIETTWHLLNLSHVPSLHKPVSAIGGHGLVLFKPTGAVPLRLSACNPFTGQFRHLPPLEKPRINPAVGVIEASTSHHVDHHFKVYVAGGMSEAASGIAASYEPSLEMFDSRTNNWILIGSIPAEFAVRLTVWTPNESVYSGGVLYWMTSARAYSIMGYETGTNKWKKLGVPMGDTLEFAALVPHNGKLRVVGGSHGGDVAIWELQEGDQWEVIERMPVELSQNFVAIGTKCVGIEGGFCLYREIGSKMVVWRSVQDNNNDRSKWCWIEGCNRVENYPIKGLFLHPNLASASTFI